MLDRVKNVEIRERSVSYTHLDVYKRQDLGFVEARTVARAHSMRSWQLRWEQERRARWTARLIGNIPEWVDRTHGEVDYYLNQFLTGHGYFCTYLRRMGKMEDPSCVYGDSDSDDARHTFFECQRWVLERRGLESEIGPMTPDNIIGCLLYTSQGVHKQKV